MKRLSPMLAAGFAFAMTGGSGAEAIDAQALYSRDYSTCLSRGDAARGVSVAMGACVNAEYAKQDTRLNAAYAAAMKARSPQGRDALRAEQRDWIRRRDASCEEGLSAGTLDLFERPSCRLERTVLRAVELERMAKAVSSPDPTKAAMSEARVFPHDAGVVDLLVIGPAARAFYDGLPGRGAVDACGAEGLHKGDGPMSCTKVGSEYSCHIWLDVPRQTLTDPEEDDC